MAPWRPAGAASAAATSDGPGRDLLEVLGIRDARKLDVDRLWSARRTQNRLWMRFPIGLDPTGEVVELDLKETSQYGMGMHSVLIGFSGSGKSETIITEVTSLALTHSPETVNVAFLDWKMKSAGIVLERFPHVVASVSNLGDEMHLVERMLEALEGELDRRGALCAATNCKDLNVYNEKRMVDPSLEPVPGSRGDHRRVPGVVPKRAGHRIRRSLLADRAAGPVDARLPPAGRSDRRLTPADEDPQPHRLLHGAAHRHRGGLARSHRLVDRRPPAREGQGGHRIPARGHAGAARVPRVLHLAAVRAAAGRRRARTGGGGWHLVHAAHVHRHRGARRRGSAGTPGDQRSRARARAGAGAGGVGSRRAAADRGRHGRGLVARDRRSAATPALAAPVGDVGDRRPAGPAAAG